VERHQVFFPAEECAPVKKTSAGATHIGRSVFPADTNTRGCKRYSWYSPLLPDRSAPQKKGVRVDTTGVGKESRGIVFHPVTTRVIFKGDPRNIVGGNDLDAL